MSVATFLGSCMGGSGLFWEVQVVGWEQVNSGVRSKVGAFLLRLSTWKDWSSLYRALGERIADSHKILIGEIRIGF